MMRQNVIKRRFMKQPLLVDELRDTSYETRATQCRPYW
jgi:hypothetical protein